MAQGTQDLTEENLNSLNDEQVRNIGAQLMSMISHMGGPGFGGGGVGLPGLAEGGAAKALQDRFTQGQSNRPFQQVAPFKMPAKMSQNLKNVVQNRYGGMPAPSQQSFAQQSGPLMQQPTMGQPLMPTPAMQQPVMPQPAMLSASMQPPIQQPMQRPMQQPMVMPQQPQIYQPLTGQITQQRPLYAFNPNPFMA